MPLWCFPSWKLNCFRAVLITSVQQVGLQPHHQSKTSRRALFEQRGRWFYHSTYESCSPSYFKNAAFWRHFVTVAEKEKWNKLFLLSSIHLRPSRGSKSTDTCSFSTKTLPGSPEETLGARGTRQHLSAPALGWEAPVVALCSWPAQLTGTAVPKAQTVQCDLQPQGTLLAPPEGLLLFVRCLSPPPLKYLCLAFLPNSFTSSLLLSLLFLPTEISGLECDYFLSCVLLSHAFFSAVGHIPPSAWAVSSLGWDSGSLYCAKNMNWDFRGMGMANCPSLLAATPFLQGWENGCLPANICNCF